MVLLLSESEVESLLGMADMPVAVDRIEEAYRQKAAGRSSAHRRVTMQFPPEDGYYSDSAIRINPGILPDMNAAALRIYSVYHRDSVDERGPRVLDYTMGKEVLLFYRYDPALELTSIMSDYRIMNVRTAAPTGVATRWLSRADSRVLGVIGAGRHAPWQIAAVCAVRPIDEVRIYSPTEANRIRLAREVSSALGVSARAVDSAEEAVTDVDVVITVTSANRPVIDGAWLRPGTHVNVIARGEIDELTIERSHAIACSYREQILRDTPDFLPIPSVLERGVKTEDDFHDLDDFIAGPLRDRSRAPEDITVFLSQGVGLWDAAVGSWVFEQAIAKGIGTEVDL